MIVTNKETIWNINFYIYLIQQEINVITDNKKLNPINFTGIIIHVSLSI